ncbi:MAG: hypothetical protein ACM3UZ_17055 [Acidobacteriota bacterium]
MIKFFIVNTGGFVYPFEFSSYEAAGSHCDDGELVVMSESLEELELCLDEWEEAEADTSRRRSCF